MGWITLKVTTCIRRVKFVKEEANEILRIVLEGGTLKCRKRELLELLRKTRKKMKPYMIIVCTQ